MLLKSVYAKDSVISVVTFIKQVAPSNRLLPYKVWRSTTDAYVYVDEVRLNERDVSRVIVSPDEFCTPTDKTSFIAELLKKENIAGVRIADKFEPAQGLAVLGKLRRYDLIDCGFLTSWAKLEAEIQRIEQNQSATLLAFLQCLVWYELK